MSQPFTLTRTFAAPRARLWQAWTNADELKQWFGPKECPLASCTLDLRPQGLFHYKMHTPDGGEMWGKWQFHDIVEYEKLANSVFFSDAQAGVTRHPWNANWPLETRSEMTFKETKPGETELHLTWQPANATPAEQQAFDAGHAEMAKGWSGTLDRLAAYLQSHASSAAA